MNNEKQKVTLKDNRVLSKNKLIEENNFNNNLISFFILSDKEGRIVLARQFHPLTKSELFYHGAFFYQFIKNFEKGKSEPRSFLDNKEFRYIYFPLENSAIETENLYSVLLIKKDYNIISSLNIIKLIQRMIFHIIKNKPKEASNSIDKDKELLSQKIKDNCFDIILSIDDIVAKEGQLENTSNNLENLKDYIQMESYLENAYKMIQREKEQQAQISLVRGIEEINRLKRENKYFDNSISSDLYNKVTEVVDDLTDNFDDVGLNNQNDKSNGENEMARKAGMILKKKLVENLIQIREDSIKMTNFYINCESIFEKLENEIKKKVMNIVNEESDDEEEDFECEVHYHTGIKITPLPMFFKSVESDDD